MRKLHPTLSLVKWDYGALSIDEEQDYIREKLTMLQNELHDPIPEARHEILTKLIVNSQKQMRQFSYKELSSSFPEPEAKSRASCCVSQRDIQRVIKFYRWQLKLYKHDEKKCDQKCDHHRRALMVSLGLVYYLRLPADLRKEYIKFLDDSNCNIGWEISFKKAFEEILDFYCSAENLDIPSGIAKTDALKENLLAVIMCCVTCTPLIIEGAPGTSKTLSFNIAVANLKGKGSRKLIFQNDSLYPSLEPQFYQCSRRTNSQEIKAVFNRAINVQGQNRSDKACSMSVVFMDEAGLPEKEHESLKVLHYLLQHPKVAFVAITNHPLDAAKTNRAISVYRPETSSSVHDLSILAKDCLKISNKHKIDQLCSAYKEVMEQANLSKFYGLRDFIYFLIHLIDKIDEDGSDFSEEERKSVLQSIERNFGGTNPAEFDQVCKYFFGEDVCMRDISY